MEKEPNFEIGSIEEAEAIVNNQYYKYEILFHAEKQDRHNRSLLNLGLDPIIYSKTIVDGSYEIDFKYEFENKTYRFHILSPEYPSKDRIIDSEQNMSVTIFALNGNKYEIIDPSEMTHRILQDGKLIPNNYIA